MKTIKKSKTMRTLEKIAGREFTLAGLLESLRLGEGISQVAFAKKLKISPSHLCDIEKRRKSISVSRAATFAKILKMSEPQFVRLALQDELNLFNLKYVVTLDHKA